jgi:glycosyltransferase involved in cell wall biosynthesis
MKGGAFEITLASPQASDGADWRAELASICDRFVSWRDDTRRGPLHRALGLLSPLPVSVALDRSANGRACVARELARAPDVVVLDFVHTAVLAPSGALPMRSLVLTHNIESEIHARNAALARNRVLRAVLRRQQAKMERFELAALRRFDAVVAVSERDAAYFRGALGNDRVRVIPTGVDVDFYDFAPQRGRGDVSGGGGRLVFTGSMDWRPNVDGLRWLMETAWPAIAAASPRTALVVVGRDPSPRLVAEVRRRGLPWTFTGYVADVRPFIRDADVCVIPLRAGSGTRLKVYEAMALGCPIVSTSVGTERLPLTVGEHYLRADAAPDFSAAVLRLLRDAALRQTMAAAARQYVAANFASRPVGRAFEAACLENLERFGSRIGSRPAVHYNSRAGDLTDDAKRARGTGCGSPSDRKAPGTLLHAGSSDRRPTGRAAPSADGCWPSC